MATVLWLRCKTRPVEPLTTDLTMNLLALWWDTLEVFDTFSYFYCDAVDYDQQLNLCITLLPIINFLCRLFLDQSLQEWVIGAWF